MTTTLRNRRSLAALAAAAGTVVTLLTASAAPADVGVPVVTLGPTTVLNGVATVSGTVAGVSSLSAQLSINGQPVSLNAAGQFTAIVNLNGQSNLRLSVKDALTGQTNTISIPLNTNIIGTGGVIPPGVLSGLEQAAVSLLTPAGGFVSTGDKPISVEGSVGNRDQLASLTVNGLDVLSLVRPNGMFVIPIPGTSKEVTLVAVDKQGTSQTVSAPVQRAVSSVSAAEAVGVRIVAVRYRTKGIRKSKRLNMTVTIKDRRGLMIRGGVITVRGTRARRIFGGAQVKRSNANGQASFVLGLRKRAFGKRLFTITTAKTPSAKTSRRTSVPLPRLSARTSRR
jgi:hypothetical protein